MSECVTIALSKGKLLPPTLALFRQAGYSAYYVDDDDRRLIVAYPDHGHRVLIDIIGRRHQYHDGDDF